MEKGRLAIVTMAIGDKYLRFYDKTFRKSQERYAKGLGIDFKVVTDMVVPSPKHPSWQKLLLFTLPDFSDRQSLLFMDADIYVTRHARDIFKAVGNRPWGIAKNNAYDLASLSITDQQLYLRCPASNRPSFVVNCGMFVVTPSYRDRFKSIFQSNEEQPCYEQGPLSYFFLNENKGLVLDSEFNTIVISYLEAHGRGLSSVLQMYASSSFIHFTAGKHRSVFYFVKWFDGVDSRLVKRSIYYFAHKRFDPFTASLFRFSDRCIGIYGFRIKRFFDR